MSAAIESALDWRPGDLLLTWPGWHPVGRANPRPVRRGARLSLIATPRTREAKTALVARAAAQWLDDPLEGPLDVACVFSFAPPPSWPAWKREAAEAGVIRHTSKPDASNLAKLLEDACTDAGVWGDDAQVTRLEAVKVYGAPGAAMRIRRLPVNPRIRSDLSRSNA